jgi:hypothetical protein
MECDARGARLGVVMLRRLRLAPAVRTVLCLAALLSVTGSLGLHAEPGSGQGPRAVAAIAAAGPVRAGSVTHICLICVLHGSVFPSAGSCVVQGPAPGLLGPATGRQSQNESPVARCHDGRAPPTVL